MAVKSMVKKKKKGIITVTKPIGKDKNGDNELKHLKMLKYYPPP